eukprot:gene21092-25845_t
MTRTSEKVARAHGVQLRVFDTEPPALAWLLDDDGASEPAANADGSLMDPVRTAFWDAYRHLFPPNAQAVQLSNGNLVIAWALARDPQALFEMPFADHQRGTERAQPLADKNRRVAQAGQSTGRVQFGRHRQQVGQAEKPHHMDQARRGGERDGAVAIDHHQGRQQRGRMVNRVIG